MFLRYLSRTKSTYCEGRICFYSLLALPLTFILPYLFYFYESPHMCADFTSWVRGTMGCYSHRAHKIRKQLHVALSQINEYNFDLVFKDILKDKITCHTGFILECFLESFPQSIIQMVAVLQLSSTNDHTANAIIVSSIFLSLLSIAFKSIMLLAVADLWTSIFNWIAAIIDFFAVFVITSWLFLDLEDNDTITASIHLQYFTLLNLLVTTVPFIATFIVFLVFSAYMDDCYYNDIDEDAWIICCTYFCNALRCVCLLIASCVLLCFGLLAGHIFCCIFVAFYVAKFGLTRCTDTKCGEHWAPIFKFIHQSSSKKDRLIKILIANRVIPSAADPTFRKWLDEQAANAFQDISEFSELREHLHREDFFKQITFADNTDSNHLCAVLFEKAISFVFLPLYLLGRIVHLIFPVAVYVMNWIHFGMDGIYLLHHVLSIVFIVLLIVMLSISRKVTYFTYCIYHIGYWNQAPPLAESMRGAIEEYYIDVIQLPIIIDFFDEEFGEDVSKLIVHYLKNIDLD